MSVKAIIVLQTGVEVCFIGPFDTTGMALAHAVAHIDPLGLKWQLEMVYATLQDLREAAR